MGLSIPFFALPVFIFYVRSTELVDRIFPNYKLPYMDSPTLGSILLQEFLQKGFKS